MYKNVLLTAEYLDFFAPLDPFDFLSQGMLPDRVCIGTALIGDGDEYDKPADHKSCRLTGITIVIEWIYVDADSRFKGIGAGLMKCAFEESKKRGFSELYAYITPLSDRDKVCPYETRFLEDYLFTKLSPGKTNKSLFMNLIPEKYLGSDLYRADVAAYFEAIEQ